MIFLVVIVQKFRLQNYTYSSNLAKKWIILFCKFQKTLFLWTHILNEMTTKGFFSDRSAIFRLLWLLLLMLLGAVLATAIGICYIFCTGAPQDVLTTNVSVLRIFQFISTLTTFLLPAVIVAWLFSRRPSEYLFIDKIPSGYAQMLTFLSILLFVPFINLLGFFNEQMQLPEFLKPVEDWMRTSEDSAERVTELLLGSSSPLSVFLNLVVIALAAAFSEEFLFRGALTRIFGQFFHNHHHIVVWSVAIIFSAIHMQFYGFVPRMLLGAYFGYLVYWGKNLWLPILAHFINNSIAVIGMSNANWKDSSLISGEISSKDLPTFALVSIICLIAFLFITKILKRQLQREKEK